MKSKTTSSGLGTLKASPAPKMGGSPLEKDTEYHTPSDVRTLHDAHKIMSDPKRHRAAMKHAASQANAMRAIASGGVMAPDAGATMQAGKGSSASNMGD